MTLGSHQQTIGKSQVHITPKWIIDRLGPFDLDPCAADPRPWDCAKDNISEAEDGLSWEWEGFLWMNPPFDRRVVNLWMDRFAEHGNGICLLHARTETQWFLRCWQHASVMLFLGSRMSFCQPDGAPSVIKKEGSKYIGRAANSGAPPVLVGFGDEANQRLLRCGIAGVLVTGWRMSAG